MTPVPQRTVAQRLFGYTLIVALVGGAGLMTVSRLPGAIPDGGLRNTLPFVGLGLVAGSIAILYILAKLRAKRDPAFARQIATANDPLLDSMRRRQQRNLRLLKFLFPALVLFGLYLALTRCSALPH